MAKKNVRKGSRPRGKAASKKLQKKKVVAKKKAAKPAKSPGAPAGEAQRAVALFEWAHAMTSKLISGFQGHQLTYQGTPTENHLLWQIGHMATGYAWFASMLDGSPASLGEPFDRLFGYQSKPVGDASAYPPIGEVQRVHDEQYARFLRAAKQAKDADAAGSLDAGGFAKSKVDLILKAAWHEGWHQGQISSLRRALGLPGAM
ncbi:MAG: DinB family protein [Phycisphaerales bacterium]